MIPIITCRGAIHRAFGHINTFGRDESRPYVQMVMPR